MGIDCLMIFGSLDDISFVAKPVRVPVTQVQGAQSPTLLN